MDKKDTENLQFLREEIQRTKKWLRVEVLLLIVVTALLIGCGGNSLGKDILLMCIGFAVMVYAIGKVSGDIPE